MDIKTRLAKIKLPFTVRRSAIEYLCQIQGHSHAPDRDLLAIVLEALRRDIDSFGAEPTPSELEDQENELFFLVELYVIADTSCMDQIGRILQLVGFADAQHTGPGAAHGRLLERLVDQTNSLLVSAAALDRVQDGYLRGRVLPPRLATLLETTLHTSVAAVRAFRNVRGPHCTLLTANECRARAEAKVKMLASWAGLTASFENCSRAGYRLEQAEIRLAERLRDRRCDHGSKSEEERRNLDLLKHSPCLSGFAILPGRPSLHQIATAMRKLLKRFRAVILPLIVARYRTTQADNFQDPQAYVQRIAAQSKVAGQIRHRIDDLSIELGSQCDRDYLEKAKFYGLPISPDDVLNVSALDPTREFKVKVRPHPLRVSAAFLNQLLRFPDAAPSQVPDSFTQIEESLRTHFSEHVVLALRREAEGETFFHIERCTSVMAASLEEIWTTFDLLATASCADHPPVVLQELFGRLIEQHNRLSTWAAAIESVLKGFQGMLILPEYLRSVFTLHECFHFSLNTRGSSRGDMIQTLDRATAVAEGNKRLNELAVDHADAASVNASVLNFAQAHAAVMHRLHDWEAWSESRTPPQIRASRPVVKPEATR